MKKHAMRSLLSSVKVILSVKLLAILINFSAAAKSDSEPSPDGFVTGGVYYRIISAEDKTVEMAIPWRNEEVKLEYEKNFVIPAKVVWLDTEYSVTGIGPNVFPDSIDVESVELPALIAKVHPDSFNAKNLAKIIVNKDNPNYCDVDGVLFSKDMTELERFPEGKVADVYEVPASVTKIADNAFGDCKFVQKIVLPSAVSSIGCHFSAGCTSLKEIVLDSNNKKYRSVDGVLYNAEATTLISFPSAKDANTYSFPETLTTIGDYAFISYTASSQLVLPPTVKELGWGFPFGKNIECITVPASVSYIDANVFWNCSALREINVDKDNPYFTSVDGVLYSKDMSAILRCPPSYPDTVFKVPEGISVIDELAFSECKKITHIQLPASLFEIRSHAFEGCCSLKSFVIPDSVKSIGCQIFFDCPELTIITIGTSVESVGYDIFGDASRSNDRINKVVCLPIVPPALSNDDSIMGAVVSLKPDTYKSIYQTAVLYVPAGCKDAYSSAEPWNEFQNIQELKPAK